MSDKQKAIALFNIPQNEVESVVFKSKFEGHNQMVISLVNGYGLSLVSGELFYSNSANFEVGILKNGNLTDNTPLGDSVHGWQTASDIKKMLMVLIGLNKLEN